MLLCFLGYGVSVKGPVEVPHQVDTKEFGDDLHRRSVNAQTELNLVKYSKMAIDCYQLQPKYQFLDLGNASLL